MEKQNSKKKKIAWQQYIGVVFFMLIGAVCGLLMVKYVDETAQAGKTIAEEFLSLCGMFIIMYVAIFAQMIIHEAGHLVFGLLSGYQFSSFRIMSFMWVKENGQMKLRRLSVAGTGGQCLMAPPEPVDGNIPVVLYNLGVFHEYHCRSDLFGLVFWVESFSVSLNCTADFGGCWI